MLFKDMPIRRKLMAANLLTSGTVVLLTCAAFIAYEFITLHRNMISSIPDPRRNYRRQFHGVPGFPKRSRRHRGTGRA